MNILELLKKTPSARDSARIAAAARDKRVLHTIIEAFSAGPYRTTQRAAGPLTVIAKKSPELLRPHLRDMISRLEESQVHDSLKRNTLRIFQFIDFPKVLQGRVATICFSYLQNSSAPIAVRAFSMTVLANLSHDHPDLQKELIILLEDILPHASAGILSRAKRILKQLKV